MQKKRTEDIKVAGRNFGTMNLGYYYDRAKVQGYDVEVGNLYFGNVAYHSTGQLISQLLNDNYNKEDILVTKRDLN